MGHLSNNIDSAISKLYPDKYFNYWYEPSWVERFSQPLAAPAKPFKCSLVQSIIWCDTYAQLASPQSCLRSFYTMPNLLSTNRLWSVRDVIRSIGSSLSYNSIFDKSPLFDLDLITLLNKGRLIVYLPDQNLSCGGATADSGGYFDNNNIPPWDCWVSYMEEPDDSFVNGVKGYLISWVPQLFLPLAQKGIEANPEECIQWLDESDVSFAKIWQDAVAFL